MDVSPPFGEYLCHFFQPPKQANLSYELRVLGDQTIQMYGNFEGFLFFFVHCLDWQYKGSVKTHKLAQNGKRIF